MIFESVNEIIIKNGSISIAENGTIVGATKATKKGRILTIGDEQGTAMFINQGNVFSFGNNSSSFSSSGTTLSGPRSTPITINGIRTTYGEIMDRHVGIEKSTIQEPTPIYQLSSSCLIEKIVINCGVCDNIAKKWLADRLIVNVVGSGTVVLPEMAFISLDMSVSGSGDIRGSNTSVLTASISVAGSGDVNNLHIVDSGSVSVAGSGDVDVTAEHPTRVARNVAGSGNVSVQKKSSVKRMKL